MKRVSVGNRDVVFYQFDAAVGFWGIPNMQQLIDYRGALAVHYHVRHNSYGVRDQEYVQEDFDKPIICLGGSTTWGSAVEEGDRFSNRLYHALDRPVLNFGHNSFGLDQIAITMLTKIEKFTPSTVIIEQYPWSLHRVLNSFVNGYVKPQFYLTDNGLLRLKKVHPISRIPPARTIIGSYRAYKKSLFEFMAGIDLSQNYNPRTDPIFVLWKTHYYEYMYRLIEHILVVIRDYANQQHIRLLFAVLPILQQFGEDSGSELIDYNLPEKRLVAMLDELGIDHIRFPQLLQKHTKTSPVIQFDGHLNAKGHQIVANELARHVRQ